MKPCPPNGPSPQPPACTLSASAAQFTITPVRIFMAPKDRAVAVTVTNESDEEVVMQADLYSWKQKADGSDDLVLTEDLILTLPSSSCRRAAARSCACAADAAPAGVQQSYRLIMRESPRPARRPQSSCRSRWPSRCRCSSARPASSGTCSAASSAAARPGARPLQQHGDRLHPVRAVEVCDDKGARLAAGLRRLPPADDQARFDIKRAEGRFRRQGQSCRWRWTTAPCSPSTATLPE